MHIAIKPHVEPLRDIPEHSMVQLQSGERVHFIGIKPYETETGNEFYAKCHTRSGGTYQLDPCTPAHYISGIVEYESIAHLA